MINTSAQFGLQAGRDELDSEEEEKHAQEQRAQVLIDGYGIKELKHGDTSQQQETRARHEQPPQSTELERSLHIINAERHRQQASQHLKCAGETIDRSAS